MQSKIVSYQTIGEALTWAEQAFTEAELYYGHGTDNAWDEAVAILLPTLQLPINAQEEILLQTLTPTQALQLEQLFKRRIAEKIPASYLTQKAWFCGLEFYVDERVIVPRSPIGELIMNQFHPWLPGIEVKAILDLCCGSACMGIACAYAFPEAKVDALDLSTDALAVANINIAKHDLKDRVQAIESDLFSAVSSKKYDLIVSNPPYVDAQDIASMPSEYGHEPDMALASGADGLDATRVILAQAAEHLTEDGILIVEVGNSAEALEKAFPNIGFTWLNFEMGGDGVFLLTRDQLVFKKHVVARSEATQQSP
jgi:ribosomal protein L3 glutamine methyltransferase